MRIPSIENWGATGDPQDGTGHISYGRMPLHWWVLDAWLAFGHPHWGWWQRLWLRILPYWGDPFCAAYTVKWSRYYWSHEEDQANVQVGWEALPEAIKLRILARRSKDDHAARKG